MKRLTTAIGVFLTAFGTAVAHELPLGDGHVTSSPRIGYLMSCQMRFNPNAPGSRVNGPWISGSHYDPAKKPIVAGGVSWPSRIRITLRGNERIISANNLPSHPTGIFPIARGSTAFRYDRNPNRIRPQDIVLKLPAKPKIAASPSCVPMGMIGFALSGAAIFNAVDARGRDAPAHEIQDRCNGHPERNGQYHYHDLSPCMKDTRSGPGGQSDLLGYALDGFGIYGKYGENGRLLGDRDLDACHGRTSLVIWNGKPTKIYHYVMSNDFPYSIGCFRGTPVRLHRRFP